MSWMGMLCEVYDNCVSETKKKGPNGSRLFPVAHSVEDADIEIFIDQDGNFIRAKQVAKEDAATLVPVTEDSAARGNGIFPMPLCDEIRYVAGDYDVIFKPKKPKDACHAYFEKYKDNLEKWAMRADTPIDVKAIYKYLKKTSVVSDLQKSGILIKSEKDFVRFIVECENEEVIKGVWEKDEIIQSFIDYYLPTLNNRGIDYVTGEEVILASKLPAKIRSRGDKSKLISFNSEANNAYTFKGRFSDAQQAVGIGYLSGQKAHSALRWLIARQGYQNDSECIICFSNGKAEPPNPCRLDLLGEEEQLPDTKESYARQVRLAISGYRANLKGEDSSKVAVMSVDTADGKPQGRLAINYYTEMPSDDFLDNLETWQQECVWEFTYKNADGNLSKYVGAPIPRKIALAAYGTEHRQGDNDPILEVSDKLMKKTIDRILPCITERKRFPRDIMLSAVRNASEPHRFSITNAHKILAIACALVHKCQIDSGKEVYDMSLNKERTDRSYLFGRLLAVADKLEMEVYSKEKVESRETNARKFWSTFVRKPAETIVEIYGRLLPYMKRLTGGSMYFYSRLFGEILSMLEDTNAFNNEQLNENYLLGYYSQYEDLWRKKEDNDNE